MELSSISVLQLMSYYIHIGHSLANTISQAGYFILAWRLGLALINLFFTMVALSYSIVLFSAVLFYFFPIWFVNQNPVTEALVRGAAANCGEFSATSSWINGAITNFFFVYKSWRKRRIVLDPARASKLNNISNYFLKGFYLTRFDWPRMVFFSSVKYSHVPVKECFSSQLPLVGLVDTDTVYFYTRLIIPGNDEASHSVAFFNEFFSRFVLVKKFSNVALWFFNIRSSKRVLDFITWLSKYGKNLVRTKKNNFINALLSSFKVVKNYNKALTLIASFSYWYQFSNENLDLFSINSSLVHVVLKFYFVLLSLGYSVLSFVNFQFLTKYMKNLSFLRKKFISLKKFNKMYLRRRFPFRKFLLRYIFSRGIYAKKKRVVKSFLRIFGKRINDSKRKVIKNSLSEVAMVSRYFTKTYSSSMRSYLKSFFTPILKFLRKKRKMLRFRRRRRSSKFKNFSRYFKFYRFFWTKLLNGLIFSRYFNSKLLNRQRFIKSKGLKSIAFLKIMQNYSKIPFLNKSKLFYCNFYDFIKYSRNYHKEDSRIFYKLDLISSPPKLYKSHFYFKLGMINKSQSPFYLSYSNNLFLKFLLIRRNKVSTKFINLNLSLSELIFFRIKTFLFYMNLSRVFLY